MKDKDKNSFELPLDPDAFYGRFKEYHAEVCHYDKNKIAYGIWDFRIKETKKGDISVLFSGVYRNGYSDFLAHYGFYKRFRSDGSYFLLRCVDNIIDEVDVIQISDFVIGYVAQKGSAFSFEFDLGGEVITLTATLELQLETLKRQCHSLFNKKLFELLPNFEKEILTDNKTECYKLFINTVVRITAEGIQTIDYTDLNDKCVWRKHIKKHHFEYTSDFQGSHYYRFIYNVSNASTDEDRHAAFRTAIGYMLHKYNAPEMGQCVICYDESITDLDKPEGGTGKGLFANALGHLSEMIKIDGKKFDGNDRFCFQRISDSTQIVLFDDVKAKLGFDRFNSIFTDGWVIEKKNKDEFFIHPKDSPKPIITSNSILDCEGSTRRRRQFILEFSNYYSKQIKNGIERPVVEEHGCVFFTEEWSDHEWQMFYSFMIHCIGEYMCDGLHYYEPKNVAINRLRQVTSDDFAQWISEQSFELNKVYETKPLFEQFKDTYYGSDDKFSQRAFTGWLKKYASVNGYTFKLPTPSSGKTFFQFLG